MPTPLAQRFRAELNEMQTMLLAVSTSWAEVPWRPGGWNRKQILGHLIDSSANNRQRFVRAAIDGHYQGPGYAQDEWVAAHGYADLLWPTLLRWWQVEQEILCGVVQQIPEERLDSLCTVGDDSPVTLRFLVEDYLDHHRGHLKQIITPVS